MFAPLVPFSRPQRERSNWGTPPRGRAAATRTPTRSGVKLGTAAADLPGMSDSASEGSNSERRRQPRVPCAITVLFQAGNVGGYGQLADLTRDGVRVLSPLRPERGDGVRIRFETPEGQKVELAGSVVWSTAAEFGVRIDQVNEAYLSFVESLNSLD